MNADQGSGSLAADLARASALLKRKGLHHVADALLLHSRTGGSKRSKGVARKEVARNEKTHSSKLMVQAKAGPRKKKTKRPVSGQSGPKLKGLDWESLNRKEKQVLGCYDSSELGLRKTLGQLASEAFGHLPAKKANSWTRNSLRKLVRGDLLGKVEPGVYELLSAGAQTLANR